MTEECKQKTLPPGALGVIIAAAGESMRMKGLAAKVLAPLAGKPVICYSVAVFNHLDTVGEIVVTAPADLTGKFRALLKEFKKVRVVAGGKTRHQSVVRAVGKLSKRSEYVAIHDGARPLIDAAFIRRILAKATHTGGAVPALPPTETVKEVGRYNRVGRTLDRSRLRLVQTPQIFCMRLLKLALEKARKTGLEYTDDSAMSEDWGHPVAFVRGLKKNIKITFPTDLKVAEVLMKK